MAEAKRSALADLANQVSVQVASNLTRRIWAGPKNEWEYVSRLELSSDVRLHSARVIDTCRDPETSTVYLLAAVHLPELRRNALDNLDAHNRAGQEALSAVRGALGARQPLVALGHLPEVEERLKQAEQERKLALATRGDGNAPPALFAQRTFISALRSKARQMASIRIDCPTQLKSLEPSLRKAVTRLRIPLEAQRGYFELRGQLSTAPLRRSEAVGGVFVRFTVSLELVQADGGQSRWSDKVEERAHGASESEALEKGLRRISGDVATKVGQGLSQLYGLADAVEGG